MMQRYHDIPLPNQLHVKVAILGKSAFHLANDFIGDIQKQSIKILR